MIRSVARLTVILALVLLPSVTSAAVPPNVTGIKAVVESTGLKVTWNAPAASDIAYYRIFFSHASILGNQGLYDDFDVADAQDTVHILTDLPPADTLYISVLAVNAKGEESMGFQEEARVEMRAQPSSQAAASSAPAQTGSEELRLLSATALTETGVLLTFSLPVTIPQNEASQAFSIRDASGTLLQLTRLIIEGPRVTLSTTPQIRNRVYQITINSNVVKGTGAQGQVALDNEQTPTLFSGSPLGRDATTPPPAAATGDASDVRDLRLTATRGNGNTFIVEVMWQAPLSGNISGYRIAQSLNGGRTYGAPQTVQKDANGIKITSVPGGQFTVNIQTVGINGVVSRGVVQSIDLPRSGNTPVPPPTGSVTGPVYGPSLPTSNNGGSTHSGNLPSSGPELPIAIAAAGALGGWYRARKMTKA